MTLFRLDEARAVWQALDGEAVVIDADTSVYYSLNRTGTAILSLLGTGRRSPEGLARYAMAAYAVPEDEAARAVGALLEQLRGAGLVSEVSGEEDPPPATGAPEAGAWEPPDLVRHGDLEKLVLSGE